MRFAVLVKSDRTSEDGILPDAKLLEEMNAFNEKLVRAGVMLAGEGLHPSSKGVRIVFGDGGPVVSRGPFADPANLVAGYWLIKAESLDAAIEWMRQAPFKGGEVELRQVFETEEFAAVDPTGAIRAKDQALRDAVAHQA